jgi:polyhydroxybutyrate depolymerase
MVAISMFVLVGLAGAACSDDDGDDAGGSSRSGPTTTVARVVAVQPSSGCSAPSSAAIAPGEAKVTLASGGTERSYFRHVPTGYTPTNPVPLVLDFHGYLEGAEVHKQHSALSAFGDEKGFVTLTPQGLGNPVRWDTGLDSADMRFVGDLLDEAERTVCVDTNRIFVTGLSNGAFMTSAIACAYADRVAAVAPVAGVASAEGCKPARPVPVVAFHGTADGYVAYEGGLGESGRNLPAPDGSGRTLGESGVADRVKGPSVPEVTAQWATRNGCTSGSQESEVASDVTLIEFSCPPGTETQLYRITDGGHTWPGSEFSKAIERAVGHTTFSIDANEVMWEFFVDHPLRSD